MIKRVALSVALTSFSSVVLASTLTWKCTYPSSASATGVKHNSQSPFTLEFKMDSTTQKAFVVGNNGLSEVSVWGGGHSGVTFLELLPSGAVQSTTVDKKGDSVHSRHSIVANLVPSQYYGKCEVQVLR